MQKALVFDGSKVHGYGEAGQLLNFVQTEHHSQHLPYHYQRARDMGFTRVRDSAWLDFTAPKPGEYNYAYLDQLARQAETIQVQVEFQHYNWPAWLNEADILAGAATEAFGEMAAHLAQQYRGVFHSWLPATELGFWTVKLSEGHWHPCRAWGWWDWYKLTSAAALAAAHGLRAGDPGCMLALSEPYGMSHLDFADQARPFATLLGRYDSVAEANGCHTWRQGASDLVQEIGLNCYHPLELRRALVDARVRFPDQQVVLAETGHLWHQWISPATWLALCQDAGADVACWGPGGPFRGFEHGQFIGGTLI